MKIKVIVHSAEEFGKILERNGWTLLRVQGSGKAGSEIRLSVPVHRNEDL